MQFFQYNELFITGSTTPHIRLRTGETFPAQDERTDYIYISGWTNGLPLSFKCVSDEVTANQIFWNFFHETDSVNVSLLHPTLGCPLLTDTIFSFLILWFDHRKKCQFLIYYLTFFIFMIQVSNFFGVCQAKYLCWMISI